MVVLPPSNGGNAFVLSLNVMLVVLASCICIMHINMGFFKLFKSN